MSLWSGLRERARYLFARERRDAELDDELLYHLEARAAELERQGKSPEESLRQARREFGSVARSKEETRRAWGVTMLEAAAQDLRYGVRQLRQSPGFAATAIVSLALGIGANTAIFQLLNAVRLRALPVRDPQQLVDIRYTGNPLGLHGGWDGVTYPLFEQIRDHQEWFSGVFAWAFTDLPPGDPDARALRVAWVSGNAFHVLGVDAALGRAFQPADDVKGCPAIAMLGHGYWLRRFGGQNTAVGSKLTLEDVPFSVVGVTGPRFFGMEVGRPFDIALPFCAIEQFPDADSKESLRNRNTFWLGAVGRLKDGVSAKAAAQGLNARSAAWFQAVPPSGYSSNLMEAWNKLRLTAVPMPRGISQIRQEFEASLWMLLGITALVLAIACVNLANVMLARSNSRAREYSVRMALGASRARVVWQLFWESLLLALGGAAAGTALAMLLSRTLVRFVSTDSLEIHLDLGLDARLLGFIALVSVLACAAFGLSTALYATRRRSLQSAGLGARGATLDRRRFSFQRVLTVGQIAISMVLVMASLLFADTFRNLVSSDAGFAQEGLTYLFPDISRAGIEAESVHAYAQTMADKIAAIPGVESASLTTHFPLNGDRWTHFIRFPGDTENKLAQFLWVSPNFLETLRIPLRAGRDLSGADTAASPRVVLVNEQFVRQYLSGRNPIGETFRTMAEPGYPESLFRIAGVIANTRYAGLRESYLPIAYAPFAQHPDTRPFLLIAARTGLPPADLTKAGGTALRELHPQLRVLGSLNLRQQVLDSLSRERLLAWLSGFFGVLALVLAAVGLYGVVSYMVSARRNEIGIRLALGATRGNVVRMVLGQTSALLAMGLVLGGAGVLGLERTLAGLLFGVRADDPALLIAAGGLLGVVGICASWVPARRSARLDPNVALRDE